MRKFLVVLPAVAFLIVGIFTLSDYGFNFDEPYHFSRGQMYLHYLLTGEVQYDTVLPYPRLNPESCQGEDRCKTSPPFPDDTAAFVNQDYKYEDAVNEKFGEKARRSFFQSDLLTFDEIIKQENGHPPLGGILASLTNDIFYKRLKILNDIEAHHIAEIIIAFAIVLGIGVFTYSFLGTFASVVASTTIATYPLFFSESHFNIKDPLETSFFGLSIILFYFGVTRRKWYWVILSAISTGLALGTKFNAVFLPFIIAPWFLLYIVKEFLVNKSKVTRETKITLLALIIYPLIVGLVFYALWPYLWPDPIGNVQRTIGYYRSIGSGTLPEQAKYIIGKLNIFPILWILTTTPPITLLLSSIGIVFSFWQLFKKRNLVYLLLLLWLFVPIMRVTTPNSAIYGGVRHILEFLPALAIFVGIGANLLARKSKAGQICGFFLIFLFLIDPIIKYHPNQNLYFNFLVGGLKGASDNAIPYAGNTYGNAYLQGVLWLNQHAEPNARLGLPIATMANVPRLKLRSDISFNNGYWSGVNRKGEYEMEVTYDQPQKQWYSFTYYDIYLNPVYELKVDNLTILKIWKNDIEHTKDEFRSEDKYQYITKYPGKGQVVFDLSEPIRTTRVTIEHSIESCNKQKGGYISLSLDGKTWAREFEPIDFPQVPPSEVGWDNNTFVFLFPGKHARYIMIDTQMENSCLLKNPRVEIRGLKDDNK